MEIRFADGVRGNPMEQNLSPYDAVYLVRPDDVGSDYTEKLNGAIADRIFMNIFVPAADPITTLVNIPPFDLDRNNRAHVFCTFGMYSVEFPAFRIMEACSKRLLAHALLEWGRRQLSEAEVQSALSEMQCTWSGIYEFVMQSPEANLNEKMRSSVDEIVRLAKAAPDTARQKLDALRSRFAQSGDVTGHVKGQATKLPQLLENGIRRFIRARLLDYRIGPAGMIQILKQAREQLQQMKASGAGKHTEVQTVDGLMRKLFQYHNSATLGVTVLRSTAIKRLLGQLQKGLESEISARMNSKTYEALISTQQGIDDAVESVSRKIDVYKIECAR